MLLAIDVGNTNIVFAALDNDEIIGQWRLSTDARTTADEYAVLLKELIALKSLSFSDINEVIISTVVPQNLFELKKLSRTYFDVDPKVIGENGIKAPIKIDMDKPSEIGADRLVNAYAAYQKYQRALIIIDFGTATTFDVVNKDGCYIGGLIAPGINLSLDALHRAAAKLPEIAIKKPSSAIGKNTISAMQAGVYFGYAGLIEGIISKVKQEYAQDMYVIATGGLAELFADATEIINEIQPDLTINGLKEVIKCHSRERTSVEGGNP